MAIQMTAKERLQAKAAVNRQLQDQAQKKVKSAPGLIDRLREEERERQANARAAEAQAQRSGSIDPRQVNKTPVQDRARMTRQNSQYQLGDVRSKQSRVGAAAQSIGLNTAASAQYLGETAKQAIQNTREYLNTQAAEEYAAAVSGFNRIRASHWEGTPEYQEAYNRVQEARKALEQTSEEVRSQTVGPNSKGSQMMAESQALKEKALEGTTGARRLLGETAISMASNLSKLPLGAAAPAAMAAEAAAGKAYELQQQGVGAGQALGRGVVSGVIEGVTEKVPLDRLADLVKSGGKTALRNILKQGGIEATEESLSYLANWIADAAARDPNAQFSLRELGESALSGGLSGLMFGLGGTAVNRAQALPGVIEQTGEAKPLPTGTSLHLAGGEVQGLPQVVDRLKVVESVQKANPNTDMANTNTGNVLELPMQENKTPESLPMKTAPYYFTKDSDFARLLVENPDPSFETVRDMLLHGDLRQSFKEAAGEDLPAFAEDAYPIVKEALRKADRDPFFFENDRREKEIRELERKLEEAENRSQTAKGFDFVGARLSVDDNTRRIREARQEYLDARTQQTRQLVDLRKRQLQAANDRKNRSGSFQDKVGGSLRAEYVTSLLKEAETKAGNLQGAAGETKAMETMPAGEAKSPQTFPMKKTEVATKIKQYAEREPMPAWLYQKYGSDFRKKYYADREKAQAMVDKHGKEVRDFDEWFDLGFGINNEGKVVGIREDYKAYEDDIWKAQKERKANRLAREAAEPQTLPMVKHEKTAGQSQAVGEVGKKTARAETAAIVNKLKNSVPDLADMETLSVVKGTEFNGEKGKLTETVGAFFRSIGGKIFRKGFGDVLLTPKSVKSDMSHGIGRAKAATFAAVPDIIANGRQIDFQKDWKGRGKDSYVFAGPIELAQKRAYVAAVVLKDVDNRFYLHEVVDEDGNVIFMQKDTSQEGQDRNYRQDGFTGAQEVPSVEAYPMPNAEASGGTPETMPELTSNSSIRESGAGVKQDPVEPQTFPMREVKTSAPRAQALERGNSLPTTQKEILRSVAGPEIAWQNSSEKSLPNGGRTEQEQSEAAASAAEPASAGNTPAGLPMRRQEALQDAFTASLNGGRTLGDNEARTGMPLPSEVERQLQATEMLAGDMDEDVSDVANIIRKYVGPEAANYWLEHRNDGGVEAEPLSNRPTPDNSGAVYEGGKAVGTKATEKLGVRIEGGIADLSKVQKAREAQWGLDVANRQIRQAERDLRASADEKRMAESVAKGQDSLRSFAYGYDERGPRRRNVVEDLAALYRLRDTYDKNGVKALGKKNKDDFIDTLNKDVLNHLEDAAPPGAASLHTNTWERNNLRTWGRELGEKVNKLIFDPIKENEASRIRWLNSQVDDLKILGDLTDAENKAVFDMLDNGKSTADHDGVRNDVVQEAADKLRQKYSDYYDAINDVLVAHGYPEIGFIKNYAPHTNEESIKKAMGIFERLGLSDTVTELPTEIAGRTDVFKPGKKWNPHFLPRTGEKTALDAVGGYLSYVNYMSEVLHHVDDIQKVRTFGDQIRYMYGDEGLKADYDAIRADTTLNEQEKETELERLRTRRQDNSKMGAYVTALDNYANILAGKQTQLDRAVESAIGRRGLNWIQKPIQTLVRSSIPGNLSSAINQTVQLPWLTAEAGGGNVLQAAFDLTRGKLRKENFGAESRFITGKRGAEVYSGMTKKTAGEKVLDAASIPFEAVDDAASQIIVRSFYLKNVKAGMDHKSAMQKADSQAERLVGSRMEGTKANIFSDKSLKLLTTFQLEVANQWQHLKFDLPQEFRDIERTKGTAAAVTEASKRIVKGTLYTFALNALIEQITGSKPAGFDVIGTILDYIRAGAPDEEEEEKSFDWTAGLGDVRDAVLDDVPFVGNIATMLGYGDGRLPLPSIDRETIGEGLKKRIAAETDEEKNAAWKQVTEGMLKSAAALVPMGNQIKKTIQGTTDVVRGGRYSADGTRLLYEVEQSPANYARGALFGRNALPETREYWDEGGKAALSQKQTGLMKQAAEYGVDQSTYVDFVRQAKKLEGDKDTEDETIKGSLERKKIALLDGMDLSGEQKLRLYLDNVASDSRKEDVEAMAKAGMTWKEMAPAIDTYLSMEATDANATQKATELAAWADRNLDSQQAAVVKERLEYWQMLRAEAESYEKLTGSGLDAEAAKTTYDIFQSLTPEEGKSQVSDLQKLQAIADSQDLNDQEKRQAAASLLDGDSLKNFQSCMDAGVSIGNYAKVKAFYSEAKTETDVLTGKISTTKKEKVMDYIDGLEITAAQKTVLYYACGYVESTLDEAPWYGGPFTLPSVSSTKKNSDILLLP